jgi:hypothetical protein
MRGAFCKNQSETKMLNPKLETPAFAGAASRRQAKLQTNSNVQAQNQKPGELENV